MRQSLRVQVSLLIGLAVMLSWGIYCERTADALSENIVRLHVVAASDSAADQQVKTEVRDAVLAAARPHLEGAGDRNAVRGALAAALPEIEAAAREAAHAAGHAGPVAASLGRERFPSRHYDTFSLPPGWYDALRVDIGEGAGRNWWCVVFPPLCMGAASEVRPASAELRPGEAALISEDGPVRLRFRTVEVIRRLRR